jgi:F-type H+-transporting ATPase subunit epsilon
MPNKITLELVTPEKVAWQSQVDFVVLPAYEGEMGILPGHAPYLVQLKPGEVRVTENGSVRRFAVSGGFAEIRNNKLSLFAETAETADAINVERARQAEERAKAELVRKDLDSMTLAQAEADLLKAQVRLKVSKRRHHPDAAPHPQSGA